MNSKEERVVLTHKENEVKKREQFEVIPSIDIYGGRCVRLYQGDFNRMVEVYNEDPVAVARTFEQCGVTRIHLVDLDAARGNRQLNRKKIHKIRRVVSCTLELGGGIRSDDDIEELLDTGIDRIVVGTAFARNPELLEGWISHYGKIFIAGIDASDGKVFIEGWEQQTNSRDVDLARRAGQYGVDATIYTSIMRDGTLEGPDIESSNRVAEASDAPVIVSGGVGSDKDIEAVVKHGNPNIQGVIVGRAIYEKHIDLAEVVKKYSRVHGAA